MTRARTSRANWSAAAVVSPMVAALTAGAIIWAASTNPLAAATEAPAVASAPTSQAAPAAQDDPLLDKLRRTVDRLERAVAKARDEAAAVVGDPGAPAVDAPAVQPVPQQPAPAPAPAPQADTWTGSSGG